MQIILDAARNGTAAYYIPGPLIAIGIARALWSRTTVSRPDGGRWTRGQRDAWMRAERRRNIAARREWERQRRARR